MRQISEKICFAYRVFEALAVIGQFFGCGGNWYCLYVITHMAYCHELPISIRVDDEWKNNQSKSSIHQTGNSLVPCLKSAKTPSLSQKYSV